MFHRTAICFASRSEFPDVKHGVPTGLAGIVDHRCYKHFAPDGAGIPHVGSRVNYSVTEPARRAAMFIANPDEGNLQAP
jgi:hypothetical protein